MAGETIAGGRRIRTVTAFADSLSSKTSCRPGSPAVSTLILTTEVFCQLKAETTGEAVVKEFARVAGGIYFFS